MPAHLNNTGINYYTDKYQSIGLSTPPVLKAIGHNSYISNHNYTPTDDGGGREIVREGKIFRVIFL